MLRTIRWISLEVWKTWKPFFLFQFTWFSSSLSAYELILLHQGNTVICGLRNGAIVTVDIRERKREFSDRFTKHRIPYPSHRNSEPQSRASAARKYNNKWLEVLISWRLISLFSVFCLAQYLFYKRFLWSESWHIYGIWNWITCCQFMHVMQLKGKIYPSRTVFMPSSISWLVCFALNWFIHSFYLLNLLLFLISLLSKCSLVSLRLYDQYFLGGSMDGLVSITSSLLMHVSFQI